MATPRTGRPRGRPPGAKNKRTIERERELALAIQRVHNHETPEVEDGRVDVLSGVTLTQLRTLDAHDLLKAIYRNPGAPPGARIECMKAAIRFEKPTLAAVQVKQVG